MALTKLEKEQLRAGWKTNVELREEKWDKKQMEKAMTRSDKIQRAIEERIEKKDRNAVERYLKAWAKQDKKEMKKWERDFAKI